MYLFGSLFLVLYGIFFKKVFREVGRVRDRKLLFILDIYVRLSRCCIIFRDLRRGIGVICKGEYL